MASFDELAKSPVLIAIAAGGALVGGIYFWSKNQPAQQVAGPTAPFSWDALSNWLQGWNGGPGGSGTTGNPPTPGVCNNVTCPPGQHCENGACVSNVTPPPNPNPNPSGCPYGTCGVGDALACGPGMRCVNGCCQPMGPPQPHPGAPIPTTVFGKGGGSMGQGLGRYFPADDRHDVSGGEMLTVASGIHTADALAPLTSSYTGIGNYGKGGAGPQSAAYYGVGGGPEFGNRGYDTYEGRDTDLYGQGGGTGAPWSPVMKSTLAGQQRQPRVVGYSPQIKSLAQYQRLYAWVRADRTEEGIYPGGYPGVY